MNKLLFIAFAIFSMNAAAAAQKVPSFKSYAVKVGRKESKQPDLASNKNARMFRTNLRNAAKEGVNFAGHYVFTTWGCGTSCLESAIIDARTGKVFFPSILQGVGAGFCDLPDDTETLVYKSDSRLLILSGFKGGAQNDANEGCGIFYFEWTGANFKQIKFIPKKSTN